MIEKERRLSVSRGKYSEILEYAGINFKSKSSNVRIDYYYDDDYFLLYKNSTTLRVRQTGDALELQRIRRLVENGESREISKVFVTEYALPHIIDDRFLLKGCLVTNRRGFIVSEGVELDLDENLYLGDCDFEVIIKSAKAADSHSLHIMNELGLSNADNVCGKSYRFFEKLQKLKPRLYQSDNTALR